jgi:hypothetical protein
MSLARRKGSRERTQNVLRGLRLPVVTPWPLDSSPSRIQPSEMKVLLDE